MKANRKTPDLISVVKEVKTKRKVNERKLRLNVKNIFAAYSIN